MALVVLLILIVGGVIAAVSLSGRSSGAVTMTVQECSIDFDGTVVASGIVRSPSPKQTDVKVSFTDADTSDGLGSRTQKVEATPGGTAWQVSIKVGDDVQRVTCTATTL